jgi:hypothetical protein
MEASNYKQLSQFAQQRMFADPILVLDASVQLVSRQRQDKRRPNEARGVCDGFTRDAQCVPLITVALSRGTN